MNAIHSITAQGIAESIVEVIEWHGPKGFCVCPGEDQHTTPTAAHHCTVVVETLPDGCVSGVYCFHDSCKAECAEASRKLRHSLRALAPGVMPLQLPARERKPKPVYRQDVLARIAAKRPEVTPDYLTKRSAIDPRTVSPEMFLFSLYQPGERVLVFERLKSQGQAVWCHPGSMAALDEGKLDAFKKGKQLGAWFLLHPVSGQWLPKANEPTKRTRRSARCVTSWRYVLFESDKVPEHLWLSAIAQLPLPIVAAYTSGGKSVHVLVRLNASSEKEWRAMRAKIREVMVPLGADEKSNTTAQLTRLPGCERLGKDDKAGNYMPFVETRLQELLYLCPDADCTPICEKEELRHE